MRKSLSILVIDDNKTILQTLELLLRPYFERITTLTAPGAFEQALREHVYHVVLLDMNFRTGINNGNEGLYWLSRIRQRNALLPIVLFTAYADIDLAVTGMKAGAVDFVTKPWNNEKLIDTLLKAASESGITRKSNRREGRSEMFWGKSAAMAQLRETVIRISGTDANVLITGENGTGKEMLAREIHHFSLRKQREMVSVDMGTIPDTLFESELFGHVKGAFTDAHADKQGKFVTADGSTLFMDEIGNMPLLQQAKLLSGLQTRTVVPVGEVRPVSVNIRLITATNRDLPQMVKNGDFREDLFYRINTIHLVLPPLRERKEDIADLCRLFIARYATRYGLGEPLLTYEAEQKLTAYHWPGNIRELEHMVEKAVIMQRDGKIEADLFHFDTDRQPEQSVSTLTLVDMEQQMIEKAIDLCEGNLSAVAQRLGISRQTLYNKMKKYNL